MKVCSTFCIFFSSYYLIHKSGILTNSQLGWTTFWFPILDGLLLQCLNACREVRQQSFGSLQRTLLSPELSATYDDFEWTAIFDAVLFPLISGLLRPEVYQSDPRGMGETRLQAASLLCKVFLYYLERMSGWQGMLDLWLRILDMMDRLMNSSPRDNLEEAVAESIKNVLLVMSSTAYLVHPNKAANDPLKLELWQQTWKRLERFMPPAALDGLLLDDDSAVTVQDDATAVVQSEQVVVETVVEPVVGK